MGPWTSLWTSITFRWKSWLDGPWPDDKGVDASEPKYWDAYWRKELRTPWRGQPSFPLALLLADLYSPRNVRKVLVAASGSSFEPHALAHLGYEVDGFDLSSVVVQALVQRPPSAEAVVQVIQRGSAVRVGEPREYVPKVGDLKDPSVCPGPYDLVLCNRTIQNIRRASRPQACLRLVNRLSPSGLLIVSVHNNETAHAHISDLLRELLPPVDERNVRGFYSPFTSG